MAEKLHFNVLRGTLHLANGAKVLGQGSTDNPEVIAQLKELAEVKDSWGRPQYVTLSNTAPDTEATGAVVLPGEGKLVETPARDGVPAQTAVVKYPAGVDEKAVERLESTLKDADHSFKSANLLSDDDLKAIKGVGPASVTLLRSIGTENNYPAYEAPKE